MMIADDGTVIPLVPAQPDLVDEDEFYDPARYRLAWTPRPMTRTEITRRSRARSNEPPGMAGQRDRLEPGGVPGAALGRGLPARRRPTGSEKDPRGQICEHYGEKIPADLAVIDMAADDTTVIALANAPRSYLQPDHLYTFFALDDIREALIQSQRCNTRPCEVFCGHLDRTGRSERCSTQWDHRSPGANIRQGGWGERFRHAVLLPGFCGGPGVASEPGTRPDLRSGRRR